MAKQHIGTFEKTTITGQGVEHIDLTDAKMRAMGVAKHVREAILSIPVGSPIVVDYSPTTGRHDNSHDEESAQFETPARLSIALADTSRGTHRGISLLNINNLRLGG